MYEPLVSCMSETKRCEVITLARRTGLSANRLVAIRLAYEHQGEQVPHTATLIDVNHASRYFNLV